MQKKESDRFQHIIVSRGWNENGLRGRSGVRGLSSFANSPSAESLLSVRDRGTNVWSPSSFCACRMEAGGSWATMRLPEVVVFEGIEASRKEVKDDTATSGDSGERGCASAWLRLDDTEVTVSGFA